MFVLETNTYSAGDKRFEMHIQTSATNKQLPVATGDFQTELP